MAVECGKIGAFWPGTNSGRLVPRRAVRQSRPERRSRRPDPGGQMEL